MYYARKPYQTLASPVRCLQALSSEPVMGNGLQQETDISVSRQLHLTMQKWCTSLKLDTISVYAEPMVEVWPVELEACRGGAGHALALTSRERLNLTLTPAAFRSIGDVKSFAEALARPPALDSTPTRPGAAARLVARSIARWLAATRGRMATLYRSALSQADHLQGRNS